MIVIVSALKLRGRDEHEEGFRAPTALLALGIVGNAILLEYVVQDDPAALVWCGALLALGIVLFAIEHLVGSRDRAAGTRAASPP